MSYSAFAKIKQHIEVEQLKSMTAEEINALFNKMHEEITSLRAQVEELSKYQEEAVRAVFEFGFCRGANNVGISSVLDAKHNYDQYSDRVKSLFLETENKHDWKCVSPGDYDTTYECTKCGARNTEQADNPYATANPVYGCKEKQEVGK